MLSSAPRSPADHARWRPARPDHARGTRPNMAKRVRGSSTRPGQRAPLQRRPTSAAAPVSASTVAPAPRPASLTDEEARRAAELEAQIGAEERSAEDTRKRGTDRTRRPDTDEAGTRPS